MEALGAFRVGHDDGDSIVLCLARVAGQGCSRLKLQLTDQRMPGRCNFNQNWMMPRLLAKAREATPLPDQAY